MATVRQEGPLWLADGLQESPLRRTLAVPLVFRGAVAASVLWLHQVLQTRAHLSMTYGHTVTPSRLP